MNAKVSAEANGQGIVVEFGKDSAFAFNAAQKAEVQELLAKTIQTVAGGNVPYRLALAGGNPSATPVAAQPASVQSGTAAQSNTVAQAATNPYAAKAVAAVRAAQAAAKASQAKASQPATQNVASYAAPSASQQMGDSAASSPLPESQIQPMTRSSAAAQQVPAATSSVSAILSRTTTRSPSMCMGQVSLPNMAKIPCSAIWGFVKPAVHGIRFLCAAYC